MGEKEGGLVTEQEKSKDDSRGRCDQNTRGGRGDMTRSLLLLGTP